FLHAEGAVLLLAADPDPLDGAALPLRPAHASRLERHGADRACEPHRHRAADSPFRGDRVSPYIFYPLATMSVVFALAVVLARSPVRSALALVGVMSLLAV